MSLCSVARATLVLEVATEVDVPGFQLEPTTVSLWNCDSQVALCDTATWMPSNCHFPFVGWILDEKQPQNLFLLLYPPTYLLLVDLQLLWNSQRRKIALSTWRERLIIINWSVFRKQFDLLTCEKNICDRQRHQKYPLRLHFRKETNLLWEEGCTLLLLM